MDPSNSTVEELGGLRALLVLPVILSVAWTLYELFYASRVLAFLVTKLANLFLKDSGIYIKSVRIHLLTGRLLFKQVHYYCRDYTIRISDGYASVRWWRNCGKNICSTCSSASSHQRRAPFLHLQLNGLECQWYNRSDVYDDWGVEKEETSADDLDKQEESTFWRWWKSNQPSIHISIKRGRVLLGNHLVERSLVFYFSSSEAHYSTIEASNPFDELMHAVDFHASNVRVVLEPSQGYQGAVSEERPPVLCEGMDDAYLFVKSDSASVTYSQDSPGIVPLGDNPPPKYAFDVKLGANTVINYSCYGNRQRILLQKFFFPNDHTERPSTILPEPGQRRIYTMFDVTVNVTSPVTLFQLFSDRNGNPAHLAVGVGAGSTVSVHQPWVYTKDGQVSVVKANLKNVKVTSSLDYQVLGCADSLEFQTDLHFPRLWNTVQTWDMRFYGDSVQANILFAYIDFVNDLLDDWLGSDPTDLLTFVPIDWKITIDLTRYEIFLFTNRYNWVDIAMNGTENTRMAFCGTSGQITFGFPFTEFNPPQQKVHFKAVGENIVVRRYVPPSCTTRQSLFALSSTNKHRWRTMTMMEEERKREKCDSISSSSRSTRSRTTISKTLTDSDKDDRPPSDHAPSDNTSHIITAPIIVDKSTPIRAPFSPPALGQSPIKTYHPSLTDLFNPPLLSPLGLPDRGEIPMGYRGVTKYKDGWLDFASGPSISIAIDYTSHAHNTEPGECTKLHPNVLNIDVDAPVVLFRVFGCLARDLLALKENYPGPNINFKTFNSNIPTPQTVPERPDPPHLGSAPLADPPEGPHEPQERTVCVYVDFKLRNVTAEFPTHLPEGYPGDFPLPSLCTDLFRVYVEYTNRDTTVRLSVDPISVHVPTQVPSVLKRSCVPSGCGDLGHVVISGVSLHCHGFTELLCKERVEYAWLMKLTIRRITGAFSTQQLLAALDWFFTGFLHTASYGDGFREAPDAELILPKIEPIAEEIKYKLLDVVIEEGDITLMDRDILTRIQTPGFDLGFCNLHSCAETLGISFQVQGATLTTFAPLESNNRCLAECGCVDVGNIQGDVNLREVMDCVPKRQLEFLQLADRQTKRLWFLWRGDPTPQCGCWGECLFLDGHIERPCARGKMESSVYAANSPKCTLGLDSLASVLQSLSIRDIDCLQTVHQGLLQHYQNRYCPPDLLNSGLPEVSRLSPSPTSDDSFVSARSSLTSILIEEDNFMSIENVSVSGRGRHKKKPSTLTSELLSMKEETDSEGCSLESYKDVVATTMLNDVMIRVPVTQPDTDEETNILLSAHAKVQRSLSDGAALLPKTTPPLKPLIVKDFLQLRLPLMTSLTGGQIPEVVSGGTVRPRERRRPQGSRRTGGESDDDGLATLSLSVLVNGSVKVVATPHAINMVEMVTESISQFFSHRSHVAILDALSHTTLSGIRDHVAQLRTENTPKNVSEPPHPLLHLSVTMATHSFAAIQLLQAPKEAIPLPSRSSNTFNLKEIIRHMTLLTAFLSGASCHALIQTSREIQETPPQGEVCVVKKTILGSVDVLVEVQAPVVQTVLCALVPREPIDTNTILSGLSREQSQLSFELESGRDLVVCDLLEAGLKEVGLTVVAKILSSEVHEEMVLDWSHIHSYHDNSVQSNNQSNETETRNNHFVIQMSLPLFWSQLSSTHTGIAGPSTGGLDLFVLHESIRAWQNGVEHLASVVNEVVKVKRSRDKRVLLTLVANAARNSMIGKKSFNPVHSVVTLSLRHSVAYSCLHQLWETLPAYTESRLPPDEDTPTFDKELMCSLLGISVRLYSQHEEVGAEKNEREYSCVSCGPMSPSMDALSDKQSVGYMSISPSPSELAIPNAMLASYTLDLRDVDYDPIFSKMNYSVLLALRESLLPFYKEAGIKATPQLRAVYHNSDLYLGDFSLEVREANMFVAECLKNKPLKRTSETPVLLVKHLTVIGSLKYTAESTPSETTPRFSLLPSDQTSDVLVSKVNISSSCSVIVQGVSTTATIPFLKLGRHMLETGRFRTHWIKQAKIYQDEHLVTPRPDVVEPEVVVINKPPPRSEVVEFTQTLVAMIRNVEQTKGGGDVGGVTTPTVQVSEYARSPHTPKSSTVLSPMFSESFLGSGKSRQKHTRRHSFTSSVSSEDIAIVMDGGIPPSHLSPDVLSTQDTIGYDTTDSQHVGSSDETSFKHSQNVKLSESVLSPTSEFSSLGLGVSLIRDHSFPVVRSLSLSSSELLFSVFGLLKIKHMECTIQIETTKATVEFEGVTGSVDTRKAASLPLLPTRIIEGPPTLKDILPTYLSVAATLQNAQLTVSDRGLPENDLLLFKAQPVYASVGVCSVVDQRVPTYRCLLKLSGVELNVKQSPVIIHKRYQTLMPAFSAIYKDVFASSVPSELGPDAFTPTTPTPPVVNIAEVKLPSSLPQGLINFSLDETTIILSPLPSLTVTYMVSPVCAQIETTDMIKFQLSVGDHVVRFSPKDPFKDDLTVRSLPTLYLNGTVQGSRRTMIPRVSLELSVKQVVVDITTDVLNQLLILQNSFIKEVNDLIQLFGSLNDSVPSQSRQKPPSDTEDGLVLLSFLDSCRLSLSGISVTVSTPLSTAIRFSTGKIDMHLANASANNSTATLQRDTLTRSRFNVMGKVDIDIYAALGLLQDNGPDLIDELWEMAYFKTRISIRNKFQNLAGLGEGADPPVVVDTFSISILSPHLYIQSTAVEQGILFWLNCKSVYNYWQNERKQLNAEVQAATEALIEKIQHRPTQLQAPSIDFSKPRLVQLTVSDVGACMPLTPMTSTPHSGRSQAFPALVVTIKEMQFKVNLSHKIPSTGNFETFCVRFAEQFYLRQKTWTLDPRKHKFNNCGSINHGTFRLCVATQRRYSEVDPRVSIGEKLLWAFQWDMSGIDVNANTDIGRHTSTIIRTITTMGSDLDGSKIHKAQSSASMSSKTQAHRPTRRTSSTPRTYTPYRRSKSVVHHNPDDPNTSGLEQDLAKQTRKLHTLKTSGATPEVVQREEDILRLLQQELARAMHKIFRHPKGGATRWNQLLSTLTPEVRERGASTGGSMRRKISQAVKKQLFGQTEDQLKATSTQGGDVPSPIHKRRTKSLSLRPGQRLVGSSSSPSPSTTPTPHDDELFVGSDVDELVGGAREDEGFTLPSIDVEVNVTINVDYGRVVLRTEESSMDRRFSLPLITQSPHLKVKMKPSEPYGSKLPIETVIHIPALTVKAHYQSIVGGSYPIPRSPTPHLSVPGTPTHILSDASFKSASSSPQPNFTSDPQPDVDLPVKKGVLSISAVIASLPEPITLTPSLLEFIEQVARPTIAATVFSSSSSTESDEPEDGEGEALTPDSWPISFPVDVTLAFQIQPSTMRLTCQPHSRVECVIQSPDVNFVISFSLFTHQTLESDSAGVSPLGSGSGDRDNQAKILMFNNLYITGCFTTFALQLFSPQVSAIKQPGVAAIDKKEGLSLTLGQALIHFSRKSVLSPSLGNQKGGVNSVDDYVPNSKLQVSVVTDIASVVFGYDMRRLNDITAFRRYWYRTSLVEALFIGTKKKPDEEGGGVNLEPPPTPREDSSTEPSAVVDVNDTISAVIVVAAKVEDLRVSANFAQVMGNADLLVTQLRCEAHCDVRHNELVLLEMDGKLDKGEVDARGGVIAGSILMEGAQTHVTSHSLPGYVPVHKCSALIQLIEGRVDYMSSCSFLTRATSLNVQLSDSWEGLHLDSSGEIPQFASVQVLADFSWDKLQLAIHRSTTKSMFNMVQKMYEFVMQQKRRSERTISLMLPAGSAASKALHAYREEQKRIAEEEEAKDKGYLRHHWLWAMRVGSVELMRTLGLHAPLDGHHVVSLGAKITVSGENFCLVCFHGPSFRETEWGVFNIDTINASFSTQAIPGLGKAQQMELTEQGPDVLPIKQVRTCQQIVHLSLGHTPWEESQRLTELAAIYRVSAGRTRPPSIAGTTTENWLGYACIDYHLHGDKYATDTSTLVRLSKKLHVQPILLVPAFTVELVNDHFWPQDAGMSHKEFTVSPLVECGLMSSFAQGISVTTNVDHYLFLHDLVKAYIDYLEKHKTSHLLATDSPYSEPTDSPSPSPPLVPQSPPGRTFECVCWELDPHLCLLSSAGTGQFNPHISWLLERLGLEHARTTIPKWIQRVAMDPLDMVVANIVELLIKITATKKLKLRVSSPPPEPFN